MKLQLKQVDFILVICFAILAVSFQITRHYLNDDSKYLEPLIIKNPFLYSLDIHGRNMKIKLEGFHQAEEFGRWTSKSSFAIGNIGPIVKGKSINICGFAFAPNIGVSGKLAIGESVFDIEFLSETSCHNFIYMDDKIVNEIMFKGFFTKTPKELGINNDTRKLGVGIKSIEIK